MAGTNFTRGPKGQAAAAARKKRKYGGPYSATYTGAKHYPADPERNLGEAIWLFFDLDDGRSMPMKYYRGREATRDKAFAEAVAAIGYTGAPENFTPDSVNPGARVRVKCWLDNSGNEFDTATYVNAWEGPVDTAPRGVDIIEM